MSSLAPTPPRLGRQGGSPRFALDSAIQSVFTYLLTVFAVAGGATLIVGYKETPYVGVSFGLILFTSCIMLARESAKHAYSLYGVHLLFIMIYFGVAGPFQYYQGRLPYIFGFSITDEDVIRVNILILAWLGAVSLGRRLALHANISPPKLLAGHISSNGSLILTVLTLVAFVVLASLGFFGKLTRGASEELIADQSVSTSLLVRVVSRGIPLVCLASHLLLLEERPSKLRRLIVWGVGLGILLVANPLAAARYWLAMALIAFWILFWLRKRRTGAWLYGALIVGVLVAMPLLDAGRNARDPSAYLEAGISSTSDALSDGDSESFSAMLRVAFFALDHDGLQGGRQIMGALLGWIPRSIWIDKPIGSGAFVGTKFNYSFTNIGCPIMGEFLLDFGITGMVLGGILWGFVLAQIDVWGHFDTTYSRPLDVVYPFWIGLIFFVSRGDLLSSLNYSTGLTLCALPLLLPRTREA